MTENGSVTSTEIAPCFLPWLRTGLTTAITSRAVEGLARGDSATASVTVQLTATGPGTATVEPVWSPAIRLHGPAEVVGIDPAQIIRRDPVPGTVDAEGIYFTLVELAAPDLPWRFTPAARDGLGRLQPWLALVVVEERDGVWLEQPGAGRLPVLHVDDPGRELPYAHQCWAWAHVHADHDLAGGIPAALSAAPAAFRSRLLCPRRLLPNRAWIACVVPTFEAGRLAGLGEAVTAPDLGLAWDTEVAGEVLLPVYHSWRFQTGAGGDFESLVRRLEARELPASVGRRDLDISDPGGGLPAAPAAVISYQGALVSPAGTPRPWPDPQRRTMKAALRRTLNAELVRGVTTGPYHALRHDPVVGPPAYAAAQVRRRAVPVEGGEPVWFEQLSTEPQHRTVASVAAEVIRQDQEKLMDVAWDHAAGVAAANRLLGPARLGWEAAGRALARFATLTDEEVVQVAGPAMARMAHPSGLTVRGVVARSALPDGLISGTFRRLTGTVPRLTAAAGADRVALTGSMTKAALADPVDFVAAWGNVWPPRGCGIQADVGPLPAGLPRPDRPRAGTPPAGGRPAGPPRRRRRVTATARTATRDYVLTRPALEDDLVIPYEGNPTTGNAEPLTDLPGEVRAALDPLGTITRMVETRVTGLAVDREHAVPDRTFTVPVFTTPMHRRLVALSVDYLCPGVGKVPDDTLGLLNTNPPFVEAFLAGLNHEMGREFRWREYPTWLDETWFQQFWDTGPSGAADVVPIGSWDGGQGLGVNAPAGAPQASLVLLIKGAILRRYPELRIYAVEATWNDDGTRGELEGGTVYLPVLAVHLGTGVSGFGFTLKEDDARGSTSTRKHPGYFFVLEQPPSLPRFGLDTPRAGARATAPKRWTGLSWSHLAGETGPVPEFVDVSGPAWLVTAGPLPGNGPDDETDAWGSTTDAAAMARITFQRPVRMLVHADSMLPPPGTVGA